MIWVIVFGIPMLIGFLVAEIFHRRVLVRMLREQKQNSLKAEYLDKQIWQFLTLDEWLNAPIHKEEQCPKK